MKVAVTGSHGLIGSELVAELGRRGDQVTRLVRATPGPGEAAWDPAAGTIGQLQRRMFTGPGVFAMDAALFKETRIHENYSIELRMEALNVFNHPNFMVSSANLAINSPQFGQVTSTLLQPRQMQFLIRFRF